MKAFRISRKPHPVFDATGATVHGGRWNSPGCPAIYAASSYSLACLELLAHGAVGRAPPGMLWVEIEIPDDLQGDDLDSVKLPGWDAPDYSVSRSFGDRWLLECRSAFLFVPSVISPIERNIVMNPLHPEFPRIRASDERPLVLDTRIARLFGTSRKRKRR